jgi:hypothetical protein
MISGVVNDKDVCLLTCISASSYCNYHSYKVLFEGYDGHKPNYGDIAPNALWDIAAALKEHVILQVCKLTDPMRDHRGNENLSVKFFVKCADFGDQSAELTQLRCVGKGLEAFGKKLKPARDKIISHFDRETTHDAKLLGGVPDEEWARYWYDLEIFVEILSKRYLKETIHIRAATATTDAAILRGVLEERAAHPEVPPRLPTWIPELQ